MTRPGPTSCAACGEPIEQNSRGTKLYCDNLCRVRAGRDRRRPKRRQRCKLCRCKVPAATAKGGMPPLYCSARCRRKAKTLRSVDYVPPPTTCTHCGGPMAATYRTRRYCSHACRSQARRNRQPPPPPQSKRKELIAVGYHPDEAAAIAAAIAAGKVTRIENGEWPDPDRAGMGPQWRKRRAA